MLIWTPLALPFHSRHRALNRLDDCLLCLLPRRVVGRQSVGDLFQMLRIHPAGTAGIPEMAGWADFYAAAATGAVWRAFFQAQGRSSSMRFAG